MWTDANGEIHFEFWEGIKFNGKCHKSLPLYKLCQKFGSAQVLDACILLGCPPYIDDLGAIREECERQEAFYV